MHIEVQIVISFGLDVFATFYSFLSTNMEGIMKNLNAIILASVWCGVAFLRRTKVEILQPKREMGLHLFM